MKFAPLLLFLLVSPCLGDEVPIMGEKKVAQHSFAELWVTGGNTNVSWRVYPVPVKIVKRNGYLYFSGKPGIEYLVFFTSIDFEKKSFTEGQDTVIFGGGVNPPPGPGPEPDPMRDDLTFRLSSAFKSESSEERAFLSELFSFYLNANSLVGNALTWGDLFEAMSKDAVSRGTAGRLQLVQTVIAEELKKALPSAAASGLPLDAASRVKAKAAFTRIANSLEKIK